MKTSATIVLLLAGTLCLTACGGGGARQSTTVKTTTTGEELSDLKLALDTGAITQREYDKARDRILAGK